MIKNSLKNSCFSLSILIVLVVVSFVYNYIYISQFGPSSVHTWRQSDSASLAMNYFHNGLSFFNPKVHALISGDSAAASEFPLTYYLAAFFYKIFGNHDYILRIIDLLLYYIGIYFLAQLLKDYFYDNIILAFSIILILLGMPVLAFYGYSFIPNTPALGLLFAGSYFYYRYRFKSKNSNFYPAILLFTLAGLIKPTMLILFLSIIFTESIATALKIYKRFNVKDLVVVFVGVVLPVAMWVFWVKHYNAIHHSGVFSTSIVPFTMLEAKDLRFALHNISTGFDGRVFQYTLMKFFFAVIVFNLIYFLRRFDLLSIFYFIFFIGTASFLLLWMKRFTVHDYYTIDIIPFYIFNIVIFFKIVSDRLKNNRLKIIFSVLTLSLGIYNVFFAGEYMKLQFLNKENVSLNYPKSFYYNKHEFKAFLDKNNLKFNKTKIAVYPDDSPNISLYYFDCRGRTLAHDFDKFYYLKDLYNDAGIEYFIVIDKKVLSNKDLMKYLVRPIDSLNNEIFVYDIKNIARVSH